MPEIPRRNRLDLHTPAEHAIDQAMQVVEDAGAHPLLTEAVILLAQAKDKVADYVETEVQNEDSTTLEQFFRNHFGKAIDFRLRIEYTLENKIQFYIHPMDVDGQTLTFEVEGNTLKLLTQTQ